MYLYIRTSLVVRHKMSTLLMFTTGKTNMLQQTIWRATATPFLKPPPNRISEDRQELMSEKSHLLLVNRMIYQQFKSSAMLNCVGSKFQADECSSVGTYRYLVVFW